MPPVSTERFARLFRSLGSAARTGFVAELYAARGWETTVQGDLVVATRDGVEERVRVVDPGRFGTPTLEDADVLVTARDRTAVREAAATADVAYLPPEAVRDRLLYGTDREAAAALFAETFDQPLRAAPSSEDSSLERVRDAAAGWWEAVTERARGSRQLWLLLGVMLVVGLVVAAPGFSPAGQAGTTVPSTTYTPGEAGALGESTGTEAVGTAADSNSRPAGLGTGSITDLERLLDGHVHGVVRTSRTLRVSATGPANATFMGEREAWNYTIRVESPQVYRFDGRFTPESSTGSGENDSATAFVEVSTYANGESKYRRERVENETDYYRYHVATTGDAANYAMRVREYLETFLQGRRSIVDCADRLDSGGCSAYRIVTSGAPTALDGAEGYRATAVVQDDGVVSSLRVSYTLPDTDGDDEREPVRFALEYDAFGETTVSEPAWLSEAKNETSG